jgi:hypothetical protein
MEIMVIVWMMVVRTMRKQVLASKKPLAGFHFSGEGPL